MAFIRELRAKFTAAADGFRKTVASVKDDVRTIGDAADEGTKKAESGFSRLKSKIIGFGAAYVGFEAIKEGVKGLGSSIIGANADMEEYQNTLAQVMKSSEKAAETIDWATKFAAKTPFEIPDIVEATTKLEIYGIKSQETLGTIGDMASVMGKPLMQAVEAIADAQTGELERLKEFGITKDMLIKKAGEMGKAEAVNAKGQIKDQKAINDALFAIMEERYQGGMELQSKTFKGMVSNIQDSIGTMTRELGKPLFEKFKQGAQTVVPVLSALTSIIVGDTAGAIETLTDALGPEATNKIMGFIQGAKNGFIMIKDTVLAVWPSVVNVFKTLWNILQPIATVVGGALLAAFKTFQLVIAPILEGVTGIAAAFTSWSGFQPLLMGIIGAFGTYKAVLIATKAAQTAATIGTNLLAGATRILNLVMSMNPIGLVVAALVGLGVAFMTAYQKSETFRNIVNAIWSALKDGFTSVINWFTETLPQWIASVVQWFTELKDQVWSVISGFVDGILNFFKKMYDTVKPIINAFKTFFVSTWNNLKGLVLGIIGTFIALLTGNFKDLKLALTAIVTAIKNQIVAVWNLIKSVVMGVVNALKSGVVAGFNLLKKGVMAAINGVKNFVSSGFTAAKNLAISAINGLKNGVLNGINAVRKFFGNMKDNIVNTVKSINLVEIGKNIINGLIKGVSSMASALKDKVTDLASSIKNGIKDFLGIASPSKVMKGFGVNIGEGLAIGMDKAQGMVDKAASTLAGLTMDPFSTPDVAPVMGSSIASESAAGSRTGAGETNYNAPLMHVERQYVNDNTDVREISTGLYGLQRNHDRSKGRR